MKRKLLTTLGIGLLPIAILGCGSPDVKEETSNSKEQVQVEAQKVEDIKNENAKPEEEPSKDTESEETNKKEDIKQTDTSKTEKVDSSKENKKEEKTKTPPKETSKPNNSSSNTSLKPKEQAYASAQKLGALTATYLDNGHFDKALTEYNKITNKDYLNSNTELKRQLDLSIKNQAKLDSAKALYNKGQYAEAKTILDELLRGETPSIAQLLEISELQKMANDKMKPLYDNESFTYDVALGFLHDYLGAKADKCAFSYFQTTEHQGQKYIYISANSKNDPTSGMVYRIDIKGNIREAG